MDRVNDQLPSEFIRRLHQLVPQDRYEEIIESFRVVRPTTFRANTLKRTVSELIDEFQEAGIEVTQVPWLSNAFILTKMPLRTFTDLPVYKNGACYVQSLSSMLPPIILAPQPGNKVLDLTAAPGSKTTQMAALMANTGQIIANDTSQTRIYRLLANLKMQGATNVTVTKEDGRSLWQRYPEYFDATLVDAPCSMEGRFLTTDPESFEDWSLKKVHDLSILQRWLLRSGISATKVDGTIVYSTCTLSPEENEGVIDWILDKERGKVVLEQIILPEAPVEKGLTSWLGKKFNPEVTKSVRIYPSNTMEGFFVAKFRKVKSNIPSAARA